MKIKENGGKLKCKPKEHSARYITNSYLRNHFLVSYFIIFLFPVLDFVVFLPTEFDWPRQEYGLAVLLSVLHSILTTVSFGDVYQDEAYVKKEMRTISRTAAILCGIALSEWAMLLTQCFYLWNAWPYFQRNFLLIYELVYWDEDLDLLAKNYHADLENRGFEGHNKLDVDCFVLLAVQAIRCFCIESKIFLAYSIRAQTNARNFAVGKKYLHGQAPKPTQRIWFNIDNWFLPKYL